MRNVVQCGVSLILTSISPLATELFAPAMFGVGSDAEGSTAVYFCIVACVHLAHGGLCERVGSAATAVYGCLVYASASAAVAAASSDRPASQVFDVLRGAQALGASACAVAGFARVRTHLSPRTHLPVINAARALLLVAAPMACQAAVNAYGWRAAFVLMTTTPLPALVGLCASRRDVPLSSQSVSSTDPDTPKKGTGAVRLVCVEAFGFASALVWVTCAPRMTRERGEDVQRFGYVYGLTFLGSVVGPLASRWCDVRLPTLAAALAACGGLVGDDVASLYVCMLVFNACRACASTRAQAEVLHASPLSPALTSGLLHSTRVATTAVAVGAVAATDVRAETVLVACACASVASSATLRSR